MHNFLKKYKKAFSLLELSISILILSVIVVVAVPLITNQMKKTDEYSYFLAFKTVENLGSQIVALGDPDVNYEIGYINNDFDDGLFSENNKFGRLFNFIFPKAYAARTVLLSFPSYEYDLARACNHNPNVVKDYEEEAGKTFTEEEYESLGCGSLYGNNTTLKRRFSCNNPSVNTNFMFETADTADAYCSQALAHCRTEYPQYNVEGEYKIITLNQASNIARYGQCIIYLNENQDPPSFSGAVAQSIGSNPMYESANCEGFGYYNMGGSILSNCSCNPGTVPSVNHPNICCQAENIEAGKVAYTNDSGNCISCTLGGFNESSNTCCPDNSYYSRTLGRCACSQGFNPDDINNLTSCTLIDAADCPGGYHLDNDTNVCVVNPPIAKARRFCELIVANYNVAASSCNTFTDVATGDGLEPISYNSTLFAAITANDTPYLSSRAVDGAFLNLTPNIIFSNGLKLWILGDKVASIAGLSFDPTDYTPVINACVDRNVTTEEECNVSGDNHYFCKTGNQCFTIDNGDSLNRLTDARNCCQTADFTDLVSEFQGLTYLYDPRVYAINGFTVFVDINGSKDDDQGGGTLWKDVFPFYVSANGKVYPGYPLNASKTDISLYQGGNSSALLTDVYYYDIVGNRRKKQLAYSSIPYARALCLAKQISYSTPYCHNLGSKFKGANAYDRFDRFIMSNDNPCHRHRCYIHVKNRIKFL